MSTAGVWIRGFGLPGSFVCTYGLINQRSCQTGTQIPPNSLTRKLIMDLSLERERKNMLRKTSSSHKRKVAGETFHLAGGGVDLP